VHVTRRFVDLVSGPEEELPLDEAALLIAAHAYPGLDVEGQRRRLDDLAAACPEPTLDGLVAHLYDGLGFEGNARDYYDPRNSYLNDVLDRRCGIPISLAVVAMEVGRRVGVELWGVGMPGHFLLLHPGEPRTYLDPFAGGRRLDEDDCRARLEEVQGGTAQWDPSYLDPVGPRTVLARMLANLRTVHVARRRFGDAEWAIRLRLAIPGVPRTEVAELAATIAAQGRFREAARELHGLAAGVVDEPKAGAIRRRAGAYLARLN
jgi:regulator of sirC expression with transglutaminase-like and TPR domain